MSFRMFDGKKRNVWKNVKLTVIKRYARLHAVLQREQQSKKNFEDFL